VNKKDERDERKRAEDEPGRVTEWRPERKPADGGSLQSEARGMDSDRDLPANSATSGGAAGKITDLSDTPDPEDDRN
jgi:hypothetical protein